MLPLFYCQNRFNDNRTVTLQKHLPIFHLGSRASLGTIVPPISMSDWPLTLLYRLPLKRNKLVLIPYAIATRAIDTHGGDTA
jgi:hypothetical protein